MASNIFNENDFNNVLDKINEQGYNNLDERDHIILNCYSDNDKYLINYSYDFIKDYIELEKKYAPSNDEFNEDEESDINNIIENLFNYYEAIKTFNKKHYNKGKYIELNLNKEEINKLFELVEDIIYNKNTLT